MPTDLLELPPCTEVPRKHWTRAECDALEASGALNGQHLELVNGELIEKMGKRRPHSNSTTRLIKWLFDVFGSDFINVESPIDVYPEDNPTNEPVPDLIVLSRDLTYFTKPNPQPQDLQLVVEISDSSLWFDLTTKAALYARAGIIEYWVLDIPGRRMIVHRDPQDGRYTSVAVYSSEETVSPLKAPPAKLRVADVLVES